jgi:chemotaxis regulatin CheY-phosphate phosphatase CheZ
MAHERASELMYDTASSLRLLDAELGELAPRASAAASLASRAAPSTPAPQERVLPMQPSMFLRAMGEVQEMLASIKDGREQIRAATSERITSSSEKLNEVSSATANAALDIMDALERAVAKVDDLETDEARTDEAKSAAIRGDLRDELFAIMGHMQFQDITSQQIMHVQSLLSDVETRLADIANLFDAQSGEAANTAPAAQASQRDVRDTVAFDPNATVSDAETRQALADTLFQRTQQSQ